MRKRALTVVFVANDIAPSPLFESEGAEDRNGLLALLGLLEIHCTWHRSSCLLCRGVVLDDLLTRCGNWCPTPSSGKKLAIRLRLRVQGTHRSWAT